MGRIWWVPGFLLLAGCSLPPDGSEPCPKAPVNEPFVVEARKPASAAPSSAHPDTNDPIAFLERCLDRYDREVRGYRVFLVKQERVGGKLGPEEHILATFRERPFSVLMEWKKGHRLARKTLYVEGEHDDRLVVQLAGWRALAGQVTCPVHDEDARAASRYPITEFGIAMGTRRTLRTWKAAQERGGLRVVCLGTQKVPELGGRECWVFHRIDEPGRDPEGIADSTYYVDVETWLQVGTVLRDDQGALVARYFFRDVELNPTFDDTTFCRERMKK